MKRNKALLDLSRGLGPTGSSRKVPLGAIVLEPVLLEDINKGVLADFPWKKLRPDF